MSNEKERYPMPQFGSAMLELVIDGRDPLGHADYVIVENMSDDSIRPVDLSVRWTDGYFNEEAAITEARENAENIVALSIARYVDEEIPEESHEAAVEWVKKILLASQE